MGALTGLLETSAPPGLEIETVALADLSLPALQTQVQAAEYLAVPMDAMEADGLSSAVQSLLAAESLMRERRGKPYDLRKLVEALEVRPATDGSPALFMRLTAREGATGRPEEVLDALEAGCDRVPGGEGEVDSRGMIFLETKTGRGCVAGFCFIYCFKSILGFHLNISFFIVDDVDCGRP